MTAGSPIDRLNASPRAEMVHIADRCEAAKERRVVRTDAAGDRK